MLTAIHTTHCGEIEIVRELNTTRRFCSGLIRVVMEEQTRDENVVVSFVVFLLFIFFGWGFENSCFVHALNFFTFKQLAASLVHARVGIVSKKDLLSMELKAIGKPSAVEC